MTRELFEQQVCLSGLVTRNSSSLREFGRLRTLAQDPDTKVFFSEVGKARRERNTTWTPCGGGGQLLKFALDPLDSGGDAISTRRKKFLWQRQ